MDSAHLEEGSSPGLAERIGKEPIRSLMSADPLCVAEDSSVFEVLDQMRRRRISCALVCDAGKLVGIFTERDHLDRTAGEPERLSRPIAEFMSANPYALSPEVTLAELLSVVSARGYRHVPVLEDEKPIGLVAAQDVVKYIADLFPEEVYNLPPQIDQVIPQVEGA